MIKCARCGNECKGVAHEVINWGTLSHDCLCDKCMWSNQYREEIEEQHKKERIKLQEEIVEEYIEWGKGIKTFCS